MSKKDEVLNLSENEMFLSMINADFKKNIREDYSDIEELAESIRKHGQLEPVGIDGNNNLIYGFRRFKAIKEILKRNSIRFVRIALDKKDRETIQLVENIHRADLTDYEIAESLHTLKKKEKLSDKELGERIGKTLKWVNDKISHYKTAETIPEAKYITSSVVNEVRALEEKQKRDLLTKAKDENLTVKETRDFAKEFKPENSRRRESEKMVNEPEKESGKDRIKALKAEIKDLKAKLKKAESELARLEKK